MRDRLTTLSALGVAALALSLLAGVPLAQEGDRPMDVARAKELSTRNNGMGISLFKALHEKGRNTFISPTSIAIALQWASLAAEGETKAEMLKMLGVTDLDLKAGNRSLLDLLANRSDVTLNCANSIWSDDKRVKMNDEFVKDAGTFFDAEARNADFSNAKTVEDINAWVSGKTSSKIPKFLDKIDPDVICYLINAVYFKGTWTVKFDKKDTKEGDFTLADGSKKKMAMMELKDEFNFYFGDDCAAVRLNLGKDKKAAMWFVLPAEDKNLDEFIGELTTAQVDQWRAKCAQKDGETKGVVTIPRFKLGYKKTLNDALKAQGMPRAFDQTKAQFPKLGTTGQNIFIGRVLHEAVLEVNEEGAEAAAATAVETHTLSAPETFTVNRPFLFFVTDEITGSILFMGAAHNPEVLK